MFSTILLLVLLIVIIPTAVAAIIGAPLALTRKRQVKDIIKKAALKPGQIFYELGCGTGRMMIAFSKQANIRVIGFELSPLFYIFSLLNLKIHRVKNYELYLKDFFGANLNKADIVFCFLMPKALAKLRSKFEKELKPGAKIISPGFKIKGWHPYLVIKDSKNLPVYFYRR